MPPIPPGSAAGGAAPITPNPGQPQLKAIPHIARMENAKRMLRRPGFSGPSGGPPTMGMRGMRAFPPGAEPGPGGPGGPDISGLPPQIQRAIASRGLDAVTQNRPGLAGKLGMPPTSPSGPIRMEGPGTMSKGMPGSGPIEMDQSTMSKEMPPGMDPSFEKPGMGTNVNSMQRLPGAEMQLSDFVGAQAGPGGMTPGQGGDQGFAMQGGAPGSFMPKGGMAAGGFNPGSLQDLYGQLMPQGRKPPQYGGGPSGGFSSKVAEY